MQVTLLCFRPHEEIVPGVIRGIINWSVFCTESRTFSDLVRPFLLPPKNKRVGLLISLGNKSICYKFLRKSRVGFSFQLFFFEEVGFFSRGGGGKKMENLKKLPPLTRPPIVSRQSYPRHVRKSMSIFGFMARAEAV